MRLKKIAAIILTIIVVFSNLLQINESVYAATYTNTYFKRLAEYIERNEPIDKSIYDSIKIENGYIGINIENQEKGILFKATMELEEDYDSAGVFTTVEFLLTESGDYIQLDYHLYFVINGIPADWLSTTMDINRRTYTKDSKFTIYEETWYGTCSSDKVSSTFNSTLDVFFDYWDTYLVKKLGFGMKALGFTSYDGLGDVGCTSHIYDNDCDTTCNNCGETRTARHKYNGVCDASCDNCKYIRKTSASHTFTNSNDNSCNGCGYIKKYKEEDISATILGGICGDDLIWRITENDTLVISGTGEMYEWDLGEESPWKGYEQNIKSIQILDGVTSISSSAFWLNKYLENVYIADTVNSIGSSCFSGCTSLRKVIIPYGVKSIPDGTFNECSNLVDILIPDTVTSFGQYCFYGCAIESFIIPNGTKVIPHMMFEECSNLKYIQIPDSVTKIEIGVYTGCDNLTDVYYTGNKKQFELIDIGNYNDELLNATIHYSAMELTQASGDLNGDNAVNNKDVEYLLWHTLFPDKYALEVFADFDFSGDVNNKDVEYLLWHTLFPEKYPLHKK